MKVGLWGTRGSLASPGADTIRYGGNTSCVSIEGPEGTWLVLDAGTGIRNLGYNLPSGLKRVDILLTHLHMDHLQGLPFFAPLRSVCAIYPPCCIFTNYPSIWSKLASSVWCLN
jgi:phosphoribosyl 1,2-cyclic phosphodiesterase